MRLVLISLTLLLVREAHSQALISIVYPRQNQTVSATDSVLFLGQVKRPGARLLVNGESVVLKHDGAFIGFLPIRADSVLDDMSFRLYFQVDDGDSLMTAVRKVYVALPKRYGDSLYVDRSLRCLPADSVWLKGGDEVDLKISATPGSNVTLTLRQENGLAVDSQIVTVEVEKGIMDDFGDSFMGISKSSVRQSSPGIYTTTYSLNPSLVYRNAKFEATVRKDGKIVREIVKGVVNSFSGYRVAEITSDLSNVRNRPGRAYQYFLTTGIRAVVDGRMGQDLRLRLARNHEGWIPMTSVRMLPEGTPAPSSVIPVVRVEKRANGSRIKLIMSDRLPFQVRQTGPRELQLFVFGGISDTDWIRFVNRNKHIDKVTWNQPEPDVYQLNVLLREDHHWGYTVQYEGTNLVWTIREKPSRKLRDLIICVDPGHTSDVGATGPRGNPERQVNVEVAHALKKRLEKEGAKVVMTHVDTTDGISLADRVIAAQQSGAHAFVSIHHNALPDGVNPFSQPFGPSVIYYHPQSKRLADLIQRKLVRRTGLPDYGVFQGNIAVCRNAAMPAVLVECAFLILPDQEEKITDPDFQDDVARAIVDGLKKFFK